MSLSRVTNSVVLIICLALAIYFVVVSQVGAANALKIGTANVTGVYYPTGGAICRLFNTEIEDHGIRCTVEATGGSIDNLAALRTGKVDLGIVQSDWQYNAYKGKGGFTQYGPAEDLRAVFSLYSEPFTVLAKEGSGITKFSDLKGKRVNFGNRGSGMRATMEMVMGVYGWKWDDFSKIEAIKAAEQADALCEGKVDAIIYAAGHPNNSIREITSRCQARLISVRGEEIDNLIKSNPFYSYVTIPAGMYKGNAEPTETFGVKATLVTMERVDQKVIYKLVKAVFHHLDDFKTLHPVFAALNKLDMAGTSNAAPLHVGAKRYFKEASLLSTAD